MKHLTYFFFSLLSLDSLLIFPKVCLPQPLISGLTDVPTDLAHLLPARILESNLIHTGCIYTLHLCIQGLAFELFFGRLRSLEAHLRAAPPGSQLKPVTPPPFC